MRTHKVSPLNGIVEILDAVVWVNASQDGCSVHWNVLDALVGLPTTDIRTVQDRVMADLADSKVSSQVQLSGKQ